MKPATGFWPRSIAGQLVAVLIASALAIHLLSLALFLFGGVRGSDLSPPEHDARLAGYVGLLEDSAPGDRERLLDLLDRIEADLGIRSRTDADPVGPPIRELIARWLPEGVSAWLEPVADARDRYVLRLSDGTYLSAAAPDFNGRPLGPLLFAVAIPLAGIVAVAAWAAIVVTRPLAKLAAAAEAFGAEGAPVPTVEDGPAEVRKVISTFNAMQGRIGGLLADNARMLAAVSHDLRTPLTRLRLRAETVDDPDTRDAMLADLEHMSALTNAALAHLRGLREREEPVLVDLSSLLGTVADQFVDLGHDVRVEGPSPFDVVLRPNELQRAARNLVENALRYAGTARVEYRATPNGLRIAVIDQGPGIPAADKERVMKPYERGDTARSQHATGSLGLGLAVARKVAENHGGRLVLLDNEPTGLVACLELPAGPAGSVAAG